MYVRQDATGSHRALEKLVELLVVAHREQHVARTDDARFDVACRVTSELTQLRREIFEDGAQVDRGALRAEAAGVAIEELTGAADGELQPRPRPQWLGVGAIARKLGDRLGAFGDGVLCELSGQHTPNRSLHVTGRELARVPVWLAARLTFALEPLVKALRLLGGLR